MRATRNGKRDIAFYQSVKRDMPMENSFPWDQSWNRTNIVPFAELDKK